jgi:3-oxoadipate enol-lactonase
VGKPDDPEASVPSVRSGDVDLHYQVRGCGPRLLFILGSGTTLEGSEALLSPFARSFEVAAADHRGLGRSGPVTAPYDMARCAGDAISVLDDLGWSTARVVGISFGGMVAMELAVTVPDRVERLALLCSSAGGSGGSSYPLHELEELTPDEQARVRRQLLDTRFDDQWLASHPGDRALVGFLADSGPPPTGDTALGRRRQFAARAGHDVWDRLPAIACPTLVAAGRFDGIAPLANSVAIASAVSAAELQVFDGGHAFVAQDPDALPAIIGFLSAEA